MARVLPVLVVVLSSLVSTVAQAQWSDDRIENTRTERRVARDFAFAGVVVGLLGGLVSAPLVLATALDEPAAGYPSARARWEDQLVGSAIAAGISVTALAIAGVTLALVPSPDEPIRTALRIGPGSLSIEGTF